MDPAEVEFLAEKEIVTIVPNFSQDKLCLIGVSVNNLDCKISPLSPTCRVVTWHFTI